MTTCVHIEPVTFTIRVFDEGKEWGDPYRCVLTVQKVEHEGYVSACHGEFNQADYREFREAMKEYGITKLRWRRYSSSPSYQGDTAT